MVEISFALVIDGFLHYYTILVDEVDNMKKVANFVICRRNNAIARLRVKKKLSE